jgi:ADP-heptose:LPS heptosyltransferase
MPVKQYNHIIISRTDSIGDVMLTLPMAGFIKSLWPKTRISFLGRRYTKDILSCCVHVDEVISVDDFLPNDEAGLQKKLELAEADAVVMAFPDKTICRLACDAGIPDRIATAGRWHTWKYCNRRVRFSRKRSDFHESQLNMKLLSPLGIGGMPALHEVSKLYGFSRIPAHTHNSDVFIVKEKFTVILHPKSKGSAVEWGLDHFSELIELLNQPTVRIIITGTAEEAALVDNRLPFHLDSVVNAMGKLSLEELISVIASSDALVAASTGPLHIAAALEKVAIGLFSPMRPIHRGRWGPVGTNAQALTAPQHPDEADFLDISPNAVCTILKSSEAFRNAEKEH